MLIRLGNCNHCGKCCLREGGLMVENPMIELHEDRCKFYVETLNDQKYGHCLIFAKGISQIKNAKDRYGNKITLEQIDWFNDNCPNYPTIQDMNRGHQLLSDCSFTFEVAVDG